MVNVCVYICMCINIFFNTVKVTTPDIDPSWTFDRSESDMRGRNSLKGVEGFGRYNGTKKTS